MEQPTRIIDILADAAKQYFEEHPEELEKIADKNLVLEIKNFPTDETWLEHQQKKVLEEFRQQEAEMIFRGSPTDAPPIPRLRFISAVYEATLKKIHDLVEKEKIKRGLK